MQATEWILQNVQPSDSILDVGIGTGAVWKDKNLNVKGFDINNSDPGVDVTMGNVCLGLPFADKSFSLGVMINTIDVLPDTCKQHAVNEVLRVSNSALFVSASPLDTYFSNLSGIESFQDTVDGVTWFGVIINRKPSSQPVQAPPEPPAPEVEESTSEPEDEVEQNEPEETEKSPKKKKPFWKRPFVRAARYASIIVGALNFIKYMFNHEKVTVPIEFSTYLPLIGGSVTHYKVTMAFYEAINTLRNYFSKQ